MTRSGAMRVGVLASGAGTNLQALLDAVHTRPGRVGTDPGRAEARDPAAGEVEVVAVGSDVPGAPALRRAEDAGIPSRVFARSAFAERAARDAEISAWFEEAGVELVVLAGYMALLGDAFVQRWSGRLVNVHPSLLPAFPGMRAIEQALDYGVTLFGVTVHLVDEGIDTGAILLQEAVALPAARTPDAVHDALRPIEHRLLCSAVRAFAAGTVRPDPDHPRRWLVD